MSAFARDRAQRLLRAAAALTLAFTGLTCRDREPTGPGLRLRGASLAVVPSFQQAVPGGPVIQLSKLRAVLHLETTPPESLVVIADFQGDSAVVVFDLEVSGASQLFDITLAATDASGDTVFRAADTVRAFPLGSPGAPLPGQGPTIRLVYSAPDAGVTAITLGPRDTTINSGDTLHLRVAGANAQGQPISGVRVGWQARDTVAVEIDTVTGRVTAKLRQRSTWIIATTFAGVKDSTQVFVFAPVATVTLSADSVEVNRGDSLQLTVALADAGGTPLTGRDVAWTSTLPAGVSVDATGEVKGLVAGQIALVIATAGGRSDTTKIVVAPRPVASISTPADTAKILLGQTIQLAATALDAQGQPNADFPLAWTSADPAIAAVTAAGALTGVALGETTVTVSAGGVTRDVVVTVSPVPVASVAISPPAASVIAGGSVQLSAAALDSAGGTLAGRTIAWTSLDPSKATVDASGNVTTLASLAPNPGAVEIVATESVSQKADTATVTVLPVPVAQVSVTPQTVSLAVGDVVVLTATSLDAVGAPLPGRPVTWTSRDPQVATVQPTTGVVTGVASGAVYVVAQSAVGQPDSALVSVSVVASLTLTTHLDTLGAFGQSRQLQAVALDAQQQPVQVRTVWTSRDTNLVTVDSLTGLVTSKSANGSTWVVATAGGKADSTNVVVFQTPGIVTVAPAVVSRFQTTTQQFTATVTDSAGNPMTGLTVSWASWSDGALVLIDATSGLATMSATNFGVDTVYAIVQTGRGTVVIGRAVVTVESLVASVAVAPSTATATALGDTVIYKAVLADSTGQPIALGGRTLSWSLGDASVARIASAGLDSVVVIATQNGTTSIDASVPGRAGSASLVVQQVATGIGVAPGVGAALATDTLHIGVDDTVALAAYEKDRRGNALPNPVTATWSSSNPAVLSVDAAGVAVGEDSGTVILSVTGANFATQIPVRVDSGSRILLLADIAPSAGTGRGTQALVTALQRAGHKITVVQPEYSFNPVTTQLSGFDIVIHLDGESYSVGNMQAAQDSLTAFVKRGGGYIASQWLGYERDLTGGGNRHNRMDDLLLQRWGGSTSRVNCTACTVKLDATQGAAGHPVLAGVPSSFTYLFEGFSAGDLFAFAADQPLVLMSASYATGAPATGPAVIVRQLTPNGAGGTGRVVNFAWAANYQIGGVSTPALTRPEVQLLYLNAVRWVR